jgi:hypothetical protein
MKISPNMNHSFMVALFNYPKLILCYSILMEIDFKKWYKSLNMFKQV